MLTRLVSEQGLNIVPLNADICPPNHSEGEPDELVPQA